MTKQEIASYIDHTLLAPEAGVKQIQQLCTEAVNYKFASVCINPCYVPYAAATLNGTGVKVCTVIGFPFGTSSSEVKAFEACDAIKNGADEIDMVINVGAAMDGRISLVGSDIAIVVKAVRELDSQLGKKTVIKVIMETCFLDDETLRMCCLCAKKAGADFVKTSTGFANPKGLEGQQLPNGANAFHVKLMREAVGPEMGVKASGGIRNAKTVIEMLEAGANRIGSSSGVRIVENWDENEIIHFPK
ncbi:MAG: deoxyribose-phosphate aldolase [Treponema sp.]|nr:deoxyribose-phosphate aldolase [Treponema sp.]